MRLCLIIPKNRHFDEFYFPVLGVIDQVDINELGMKYQLEQEVERYWKFQSGVLGIKPDLGSNTKTVETRTYAKYLLKEGTMIEKIELLSCLKSKLILKDRLVTLKS